MPEIEVTEDQVAYLEAVREDIQSEIVGKYGTVSVQDALQYLIDSHDGGVAIDEEMDDGDTDAIELEIESDDGGEGPESADESDDETETTEIDADDEDEDEDDTSEGEREDDAEDDSSADGADEDPSPGDGDEADDDMLNEMMQLLDTHDDKWRESDGDGRYEVDLPDGSTETANTKDDVRALLFQHYR